MLTTLSANDPSTVTESPSRDTAAQLQQLTTESQNEASQGLDTKSALEIARIINHEDSKIAAAVKKALPEIAQVIDQVARSLRDGGRLIYVGDVSSGRIAALDASECPPTYSTVPGQVQYIMAGGPKALASAVEVNEDSEELGQRDIARRRPTPQRRRYRTFRFRTHPLRSRRSRLCPGPRSQNRSRHLQLRHPPRRRR